jgi:hypothetical protein
VTDRELLEAAARAAGLTVLRSRLDDPLWRDLLIDMRPQFPQASGWNPLTDDGDALRLAVRLGIADLGNFYDGDEGDPYAATRRAIVRAAAAMAPQDPTC